MDSGQHTDTDTTEDILASLKERVDMVHGVNKLLVEEHRELRKKNMYLENVVLSIWDATMGPKPKPTPKPKKKKKK